MKNSIHYPQINKSHKFLKKVGLIKNYNPHQKHPQKPGALFRDMNYDDYWKTVYSEAYYTFLLEDNSLICFENQILGNDDFACYTYLECPYSGGTYQDFLENIELSYDTVGDERQTEYEQYLTELEPKPNVNPIRYEFRPDQHNPGLHPASHLHVGFQNDFRLGCGVLFTPLMFVLFIIRQVYPNIWQQELRGEIDPIISSSCPSLPKVTPAFLHKFDKFEPYLFSH